MSLAPEHLAEVCKLGQGAETCRYLVMAAGFECAKLSSLRPTIDARAEMMSAKGDNCEGVTP